MNPVTASAATDLSKATTGVSFDSVYQQDRPLVAVMEKVAKVVRSIARENGVDMTAAAAMVDTAERMHPGFVEAKSAVLDQYQAYRNAQPGSSYVEPSRRNRGK